MKFFGQQQPTLQPLPKSVAGISRPKVAEVHNSILESLSDEQKLVIKEIRKGNSVVVDSVIGSGKALPNYQGVLTPTGYVPIGQIKVGDLVASNDGKFYPVLGVFPQGVKDIYEFTFTHRIKVRASGDHIWTVSRDYGRTYHDETTKEIIEKKYKNFISSSHSMQHQVELPNVKPLELPEKDLPIDPYLLGCLIGDGGLNGSDLTFSSEDQFIIDKVDTILKRDWNMELRKHRTSQNSDWSICHIDLKFIQKNYRCQKAPLKQAIFDLELNTLAKDKHIPRDYLFSSIEQRRALLAGLMDTDGYVSKSGERNFTTVSQRLADDVEFLLDSLGYMTRRKRVTNWYTLDGVRKPAQDAYSLDFYGSLTASTLPRKLERETDLTQKRLRHTLRIHNIEYIGEEECTCITVAAPNHLFLTEHAVPTHNTRTLQAIVNEFSHSRILYLTYNRLLKMDAQEKIKNNNATVQNYHGFVYKYLSRRDIKVSPDKQIKAFLEKCSDVPLIYDIICIDEYQDLEEDTVQLLLHIHKECPNAQWVFVGDMHQKIYDKTKVDVYKDCIEKIIPDYVPLSFTQSFRMPKEHAAFLSQLWSKDIVGVNNDCVVETTEDFDELLYVLDNTPNKDILVLGPRYGLTQELVNMLEQHNPAKYNKQTVWTSIRDKDENFKIQPDSLIVTTYDGCKGMERPVCIVIDWTNSHFKNRVEKPFTDQTIIRNLFCVAASRGKKQIIFYKDRTHKTEHFLCQDDLTLSYTQDLPDFNPASMFAFKHPADIARCMEDLEIEDIPQEDTFVIEPIMADANIDLAPVVGHYQEIAFFKNFNFQRELDRLDEKPLLPKIRKWIADQGDLTVAQKSLALVAYDTELFRYCQQATQDFISQEMHDKLIERLSSKLDCNSNKIQVPCHIVDEFTANGFIDYVDSSNIPWELKFVASLSSESYLQTAMYIISHKAPYAYLWNTRDNTLKKVSIKDKNKFLSDVYTCITLGRKLRRY